MKRLFGAILAYLVVPRTVHVHVHIDGPTSCDRIAAEVGRALESERSHSSIPGVNTSISF